MNAVVVIGFSHSTIGEILVKWTFLLALAWLAHWVVRFRHARLRLILWRSVLCFGLVLPVTSFLLLPVVKIPIKTVHYSPGEVSDRFTFIPSGLPLQRPPLTAPSTRASAVTTPSREQVSYLADPTLSKKTSWNAFFASIWALGFLWAATRLLGFHVQLHRLRRKAVLPAPELWQMVGMLQHRLGVRRAVGLGVCDTIGSPFICGLFRATILMPTATNGTTAFR